MEIKSCPFCNEKPVLLNDNDPTWPFSIYCPGCGISTEGHTYKKDVIELWNTRHNSHSNMILDLLKKIEFIREMAAEDIRLGNAEGTMLHSIEANARTLVLELSYEQTKNEIEDELSSCACGDVGCSWCL